MPKGTLHDGYWEGGSEARNRSGHNILIIDNDHHKKMSSQQAHNGWHVCDHSLSNHLCPGHGLWVHGVWLDGVAHLLQSSLEQLPQGGLATPTGAHNDHAHPLTELLTQLYCFTDLNMVKAIITMYIWYVLWRDQATGGRALSCLISAPENDTVLSSHAMLNWSKLIDLLNILILSLWAPTKILVSAPGFTMRIVTPMSLSLWSFRSTLKGWIE